MKKLILLSFFVVPSLVWAQNTEEVTNDFKPAAGEKTLELQFTPFSGTPISINGLRLRSFVSSTRANRLNVSLSVGSNTSIIQQENPDFNQKELKSNQSFFSINIAPGMEYHLNGTERLSPYYGWEGSIGYRRSSVRTENQAGDDIYYQKTVNGTNNGFIRLGANVLAGLDFYITKKLYLGTEISFGASYVNYMATTVKSDAPGFTEPEPVKRGHDFGIGFNANSQIRLGLSF